MVEFFFWLKNEVLLLLRKPKWPLYFNVVYIH